MWMKSKQKLIKCIVILSLIILAFSLISFAQQSNSWRDANKFEDLPKNIDLSRLSDKEKEEFELKIVRLVDEKFRGGSSLEGLKKDLTLKEAELKTLKYRLDQIPLEIKDLTKKKDALGKELGPIQGEINKIVKELKLKRELEVGEIDKEIEGLRREKDKLEKDVALINKKKKKTNEDNAKLDKYNILVDGISKFTKLKTKTVGLKDKKKTYSGLLDKIGGLKSEENEIKSKIEIKQKEIDDLKLNSFGKNGQESGWFFYTFLDSEEDRQIVIKFWPVCNKNGVCEAEENTANCPKDCSKSTTKVTGRVIGITGMQTAEHPENCKCEKCVPSQCSTMEKATGGKQEFCAGNTKKCCKQGETCHVPVSLPEAAVCCPEGTEAKDIFGMGYCKKTDKYCTKGFPERGLVAKATNIACGTMCCDGETEKCEGNLFNLPLRCIPKNGCPNDRKCGKLCCSPGETCKKETNNPVPRGYDSCQATEQSCKSPSAICKGYGDWNGLVFCCLSGTGCTHHPDGTPRCMDAS